MRALPPRAQAAVLALVLGVASVEVVTYDHPPGVPVRDLAAVAEAARARGTARVEVRLTVTSPGDFPLRGTGEGEMSFADGTSRLTMSMPGATARFGAPPEYDVVAAAGRGYVRPLGAPSWLSFDEPRDDFAPGALTAVSLLDLIASGGTLGRAGGGAVGGVGCDRYGDERGGERLDVWVDGDGLPRRVEWSVPAGEMRFAVRADVSSWGVAVHVDVPDGAVHVGDAGAALRDIGVGLPS